jgi:DNA polymerase II large subunit
LVLNAHIRAGEVDDQILDFEVCSEYPLEMYEMAEEGKHSSEVKIETVKTRLQENKCPFTNIGFTHNSSDFNESVVNSAYKILPTMKDKVENQMELVQKIRAVNTDDVARLIIERHFIRDIRGNLAKMYIESIFGKDADKQIDLKSWF